MIPCLTSEKGFTLYVTFVSLLLLSGIMLHVASLYEQEAQWFELERKEALFHHAKFEVMEDIMLSRETHALHDVFSYRISEVKVDVQITCMDDRQIWYSYTMSHGDTERRDVYQWLMKDRVYRLAPQGSTCS